MTTFRTLILLPAAMVATLGLVGCSGGGGPSAPDIDPDTPPPSASPGIPPGMGPSSTPAESAPAASGVD
ncbi:hypothetical protein ElP_38570 [Tautonia plasticadhaerens]|uniref:Uncharacterized protein n=1 Tax=Tautonia plasticadhaerens TaxID=2527974 RepID=A0A518H543_9BACT|nr:hypothetical protein ElP_38570 [Tautonia plasticadhaerens]